MNEMHTKASAYGMGEDLRAAVDTAGIPWDKIFQAVDLLGPVVIEVLKKLLLG